MNFAAAEQIKDQKENDYPKTVAMVGEITEFMGEGITESSGKPWKKVKVKDTTGALHNVMLRGTLPDVTVKNQNSNFSIACYTGTYQNKPYTGYSGFWNGILEGPQEPAQQEQAPPSTPEDTPQQGKNSPRQAANAKQDSFQFSMALLMTVVDRLNSLVDEPGIEGRTKMYCKIMETREFPATMSSDNNIFNTPAEDDDSPPDF